MTATRCCSATVRALWCCRLQTKPGILAIEIGAEYSDGITLKTPLDSSLSSPLHYLAGEHERRAGDWYTKMNGRAIMKLSLTHVPKAIDNVMQRAGLSRG
jgi:3-oxoacyl-[acyl-carrier-protein] synthase III